MAKVAVIIAFCVLVADVQSTLYPANFAYPANYGYPGAYPPNYGSPANFAYPPNPVYTINIFYPAHFDCPNYPAHLHNSTHPSNPDNTYPNSVTNPPNSVNPPTTTTHPNHHETASATNPPKIVYSSTPWPNSARPPYNTSPNYQDQDSSTYQSDIRYPYTLGHATEEPDIAVASTSGLGGETKKPPFEHSNSTGSANAIYPNNSTFSPNNSIEEPLGRICFNPLDLNCLGGGDVFDYGCHDVHYEARGFTSVVDTFGKRFYLFEHPGCEGRRFRVGPGCFQDDCCPFKYPYPDMYSCHDRKDAYGYKTSSYMLC